MINATTINKLNEMRLIAMAESYQHQLQESSFESLSFEECFRLMVGTEWARRKNNRLTKLIRQADFQHSDACIENIEYHADRKLDKTMIARLATCTYIQERHNLIILGASGAGKPYLSCAFGNAACRNFYTVKYIHLPDLSELTHEFGKACLLRV
jgi:DNA replication protein DnaC